jgi:hypothetical protein
VTGHRGSEAALGTNLRDEQAENRGRSLVRSVRATQLLHCLVGRPGELESHVEPASLVGLHRTGMNACMHPRSKDRGTIESHKYTFERQVTGNVSPLETHRARRRQDRWQYRWQGRWRDRWQPERLELNQISSHIEELEHVKLTFTTKTQIKRPPVEKE